MVKILLLGSGGFIGQNLIKHSLGGFEYDAPSSQDLDLLSIHTEALSTASYDVVINCASTYRRGGAVLDHVIMENILRAFPGSKIIHMGSMSETCRSGVISPRDGGARTDYGRSKEKASQYLQERCKAFISLRLFGVFGQFEPADRLVPSIIHSLKTKTPLEMSDGLQVRDFVNARIVCRIVRDVLVDDLFVNDTVNVGSGRGLSLKQLIASCATRAAQENFIFGARARKLTDVDIQVADLSKTHEYFKFYENYISTDQDVVSYIVSASQGS